MKKTILSTLSPTLAVALGLVLYCSSVTLRPLLAQSQSLRAQITFNDDRRQIGVLLDSNELGISFALQEGLQRVNIAYTDLKAIDFQDAGQIMQAPRAAYLSGDWKTAEASMAQVADAFPQAAYVPNSFATEARYYQMDSLRQLGRYSDIGRLFVTPTGKALTAALNDVFDQQVSLLRLWAFYGAGNTEALGTELEAYLKPQVGDSKMLPDAEFADGTTGSDLAQLTFLRGKVHQANERLPQALEDYYRAFTLTHGNQPVIAKEAMIAAMKIQAADPAVADKPSKLWGLQSVAYVFKRAFNQGDIDAELIDYAVKPDLPDAMSDEAPAPAAEKPAPGAEKPAEAKPAEKAPAAAAPAEKAEPEKKAG